MGVGRLRDPGVMAVTPTGYWLSMPCTRARDNTGEYLVRVAPDLGRLLRGLVERPLRQRKARAEMGDPHAHARADADLGDQLGPGERARCVGQIADDADRL